MCALARINKYNKGNKMQATKNTETKTPINKVLTGIKYSLAFVVAFNVNIELNTNVTIHTARVLP